MEGEAQPEVGILATTFKLGRLIIPKLHTRAPGSKQGRGMLQITPLAHSRTEVYSQVCGHLGLALWEGRREAGKSLNFQMSLDYRAHGFGLGWDFPQAWTIVAACMPPWLGNSPPNTRIAGLPQEPWGKPKPVPWQQYLCGWSSFL